MALKLKAEFLQRWITGRCKGNKGKEHINLEKGGTKDKMMINKSADWFMLHKKKTHACTVCVYKMTQRRWNDVCPPFTGLHNFDIEADCGKLRQNNIV